MHDTRNPLEFLSIAQIQDLLAAGQLDPHDVARAQIQRARQIDAHLHAYLYLDDSPNTTATGPLAGVTVAVKDTQPVAGMPWTEGSRRWRDRIATADSVAVRRLRNAGAIILGKTNLPELAAAIGTTNELTPPTENPWRSGYSPGGSSGGSAVAVASGLAAVATGDDMGGSIRIPASATGVAGLRPSPGRVPDETPEASRLSSSGPLARTIDDLRRLFAVLVNEKPERSESRPKRIGMIRRSPHGVDDACVEACERAAKALGLKGHTVVSLDTPLPSVADEYITIRTVSLGAYPGEPEEYGTGVRDLIAAGRAISGVDFYRALERGIANARALNDLVENDFDALLTPTLGTLPLPIPDVPRFLSPAWKRITGFVLPISFSGLPAVSVPAGMAGGLPVGVQLIGTYRGEWPLLSLAADLEAAPGFGYQPVPTP